MLRSSLSRLAVCVPLLALGSAQAASSQSFSFWYNTANDLTTLATTRSSELCYTASAQINCSTIAQSSDLAVAITASSSASSNAVIYGDTLGLGVSTYLGDLLSEASSKDSLTLSFNQAITLDSLSFSWFLPGVSAVTVSDGTHSYTLSSSSTGYWYNVDTTSNFNLSSYTLTGKTITLTATSGYFRLAGFTAEAAAVPEPASLSMAAMGLAGIGLVAVRRRRAGADKQAAL